MAQLIVRNLEEAVKRRLKRRAERNGQSMEQEARDILIHALRDDTAPPLLGTLLASRFAGLGLDDSIPEHRGQEARAAALGERPPGRRGRR
jgi:plasmid stability protein